MNQGLRHIVNLDWITFILLGCLIAIASLKYVYPKRFEDFLFIITSDKFLTSTSRSPSFLNPFNSLLLITDWIIVSLFIYIGYCFYSTIELGTSFSSFLYILGGYIVFDLLKLLLERVIGYTLNISELIKGYVYRKITFKNFLSIILLLFCILLCYNKEYLRAHYLIFLGIFCILYLLALLFTLRKFQSEIVQQPSYFILYFCTLEIAPYYIMYKVFI